MPKPSWQAPEILKGLQAGNTDSHGTGLWAAGVEAGFIGLWIDLSAIILEMKQRGSSLTRQAILNFFGIVCGCVILGASGCKPVPEPPAPPATPPVPMASPANLVPIPEEFFTSTPAPTPVKPVLPRVVFATSDFQVITANGIQGIRAGEALNFIREDGGDYVVQHGKLEFRKSQSYFASTYEEPARPEPTPLAGENAPVATMAEPALPDETPLSGAVPSNDPALVAETKKVGELTESIRKLNDQIRTAQDDLSGQSGPSAGGASPAPQEIKKASRAIEKLKAQRDALSGQLTEMGKP